MSMIVWLPVGVAVAAGFASGLLHNRTRPALAARLLTASLVSIAVAVVCGLVMAAFGVAAHVAPLSTVLGWCDSLVEPHHHVPTIVGVLSGLALLVGVGRMILWRRHRRAVADSAGLVWEPVQVIVSDEPMAYCVPGPPGHVVVSSGMLDCLDPPEQAALLAHEQAHLDHRHHRYVSVAESAARAVPLLHPLRERVRFCTERWADEIAADAVGDRRVVATAIARAALARSSAPFDTLELAGHGVAARVSALLRGTDAGGRSAPGTVGLGLAVAVTVTAALVQVSHLITYIAHVC